MCAEFKKNIKTVPDICVWDRALDSMSFVWPWKTPIGQIGLNVALLFLWQPPKPHLFHNLSSLHTALYLCALVVMVDVQKFLCLPHPLTSPRAILTEKGESTPSEKNSVDFNHFTLNSNMWVLLASKCSHCYFVNCLFKHLNKCLQLTIYVEHY